LAIVSLTVFFFFFQAEDGIRDFHVTGVQTCALPISGRRASEWLGGTLQNGSVEESNLRPIPARHDVAAPAASLVSFGATYLYSRSEERRVGKECRSRWARYGEKQKRRKHR